MSVQTTVMLSMETSQREGSVALRDQTGTIQSEALHVSGRHDDDLLPAIDRLFKRADVQPRDLDAVAISIGPGGFTGLRIAVSTAKMFAEALNVKLVAVPSALVAAAATPIGARRILVAAACKGDSFWATQVHIDNDVPRIASPAGLQFSAEFSTEGIEAVLADDHFPEAARRRCESLHLPLMRPSFTAQACLRIADCMARAGEFVDPLNLTPLYPRQPEAVRMWKQQHHSL